MNGNTSIRQDVAKAVAFLKEVGCTEVFLFGSTASGEERERSDIDIAVRGINPRDFFEVYGELMSRLNRPVDLVDLDIQKQFGKQLIKTGGLKRIA